MPLNAILLLYPIVIIQWCVRYLFVLRLIDYVPGLRPSDPSILDDLEDDSPPSSVPLVSILIPAKDEEHSIAGCLQSVCSQNYPNVEIIVVNDRSQDRTADIVREIAQQDSRIQLLEITDLPSGWTGKTHALWEGTRKAKGDWLWYVDSDTVHAKENLGVALHYALRKKADLVSLLPAFENKTFWEKAVQPLAAALLMKLYNLVRLRKNDLTKSDQENSQTQGFANGQYLLMRRDVYYEIGGHQSVCDQFLEDVALGHLIRSQGYRVEVVLGTDVSKARMYTNLREIVHGWSRIFYGVGYANRIRLIGATVSIWLFSITAYQILPFWIASYLHSVATNTDFTVKMTVLAGMNCFHFLFMMITLRKVYQLTNSSIRYLAYYPLACIVASWFLIRALTMCFTHRVTWRGRSYRRNPNSVLPLSVAADNSGPLLKSSPGSFSANLMYEKSNPTKTQ